MKFQNFKNEFKIKFYSLVNLDYDNKNNKTKIDMYNINISNNKAYMNYQKKKLKYNIHFSDFIKLLEPLENEIKSNDYKKNINNKLILKKYFPDKDWNIKIELDISYNNIDLIFYEIDYNQFLANKNNNNNNINLFFLLKNLNYSIFYSKKDASNKIFHLFCYKNFNDEIDNLKFKNVILEIKINNIEILMSLMINNNYKNLVINNEIEINKKINFEKNYLSEVIKFIYFDFIKENDEQIYFEFLILSLISYNIITYYGMIDFLYNNKEEIKNFYNIDKYNFYNSLKELLINNLAKIIKPFNSKIFFDNFKENFKNCNLNENKKEEFKNYEYQINLTTCVPEFLFKKNSNYYILNEKNDNKNYINNKNIIIVNHKKINYKLYTRSYMKYFLNNSKIMKDFSYKLFGFFDKNFYFINENYLQINQLISKYDLKFYKDLLYLFFNFFSSKKFINIKINNNNCKLINNKLSKIGKISINLFNDINKNNNINSKIFSANLIGYSGIYKVEKENKNNINKDNNDSKYKIEINEIMLKKQNKINNKRIDIYDIYNGELKNGYINNLIICLLLNNNINIGLIIENCKKNNCNNCNIDILYKNIDNKYLYNLFDKIFNKNKDKFLENIFVIKYLNCLKRNLNNKLLYFPKCFILKGIINKNFKLNKNHIIIFSDSINLINVVKEIIIIPKLIVNNFILKIEKIKCHFNPEITNFKEDKNIFNCFNNIIIFPEENSLIIYYEHLFDKEFLIILNENISEEYKIIDCDKNYFENKLNKKLIKNKIDKLEPENIINFYFSNFSDKKFSNLKDKIKKLKRIINDYKTNLKNQIDKINYKNNIKFLDIYNIGNNLLKNEIKNLNNNNNNDNEFYLISIINILKEFDNFFINIGKLFIEFNCKTIEELIFYYYNNIYNNNISIILENFKNKILNNFLEKKEIISIIFFNIINNPQEIIQILNNNKLFYDNKNINISQYLNYNELYNLNLLESLPIFYFPNLLEIL